MEIKINKDIRVFRENYYFGLTLRQALCALGAVITNCIAFFQFSDLFTLTSSSAWLYAIITAPWILIGFFTYHQLSAVQLFVLVIKQLFLMPKNLRYQSSNFYYKIQEQDITQNLTGKQHKRRNRK